jgi:hypothetical protein
MVKLKTISMNARGASNIINYVAVLVTLKHHQLVSKKSILLIGNQDQNLQRRTRSLNSTQALSLKETIQADVLWLNQVRLYCRGILRQVSTLISSFLTSLISIDSRGMRSRDWTACFCQLKTKWPRLNLKFGMRKTRRLLLKTNWMILDSRWESSQARIVSWRTRTSNCTTNKTKLIRMNWEGLRPSKNGRSKSDSILTSDRQMRVFLDNRLISERWTRTSRKG